VLWSFLVSAISIAQASPLHQDVRFTYEVRVSGHELCSGSQILQPDKTTDICTRHYNEGTIRFRAKVKPLKDGQFLVTGYISEQDKDEMPTSLSSPQLRAAAHQPASISIGSEDGPEDLSLTMTVSPL